MKVIVLMSSFNGQKYIASQIESILNQEEVGVHLLIRDDGSSDSTIKIIDNFAQNDSRVTYYRGDNIRPAKSFFNLVQRTPRADYYAFSDQDDVWDPRKLIQAIAQLKEFEDNTPLLYYSNLKIVDEDLSYIRMHHKKPQDVKNKYVQLTEHYGTGCTMVFNEAARQLCISTFPDDDIMHDTWFALSCGFLGRIVYDHNSYISYRQHSNNVVGVATNFRMRLKRSMKRLLDSNLQPRYTCSKIVYKQLYGLLDTTDRKKIGKMAFYKDSVLNRMKLLFDKDICCTTVFDDIKYRLLILLGII